MLQDTFFKTLRCNWRNRHRETVTTELNQSSQCRRQRSDDSEFKVPVTRNLFPRRGPGARGPMAENIVVQLAPKSRLQAAQLSMSHSITDDMTTASSLPCSPAVTLVQTASELDQCVAVLAECGSPWGVDCEWAGGPVELLQVCTTDHCFLIRLPHCPNRVKLEPLLSNAEIIKAGVGIAEDAARLSRDHALSLRGCVGTWLRNVIIRTPFRSISSFSLMWFTPKCVSRLARFRDAFGTDAPRIGWAGFTRFGAMVVWARPCQRCGNLSVGLVGSAIVPRTT